MSEPSAAPTPTFSVVVPTRHRLETLAACLERLAPGTQNLDAARYEVIVADDGVLLTAETLVCERFPWARWTAGPRRGPASNRNHGARLGRGSWLIFTDDDCQPEPGWLAAFAREVDAGRPPDVLEGCTRSGVDNYGSLQAAPVNETGGFLWSCNLGVTRGTFDRLGGFDEGFKFPHLEDVDFRLRLADLRATVRFVPDAVVVHPPRPVLPILRQVRVQESTFYLARKRNVSLSELNFSPSVLLRAALKCLGACRTPREFLLVAWASVAEMTLLLFHVPLWMWRYRRGATLPQPPPPARTTTTTTT